ncbi:MAG: hypothetical protein ACE5HK_01875 [Candidatus Methylomirabilales bacterium]
MRLGALGGVVWALAITGCVGPVSLHQSVLGYDETVSALEREMLLVNIARKDQSLPVHFTVTSSIAATFDYRANAGFIANFLKSSGLDAYALNFGASAAENPTLSIVPIQGEEFTRRILTPMDESKFEFLVFQGAPIDMVMRLMADGIEVQTRDGKFERFILNWPSRPTEYEEFRQRALHLAWLNANRKLFVGTLFFTETIHTKLAGPPSAGELMSALDKGYWWRREGEDGTYALTRPVTGRVVITNYDPRRLSDEQRQTLNLRATANPSNFILVDVRPGHPGGDFPLFGALKLRSLNVILAFVAAGINRIPEYDVEKDPRTGEVVRNPRRTLAIEVMESPAPEGVPQAFYAGQYYSVGDTLWDREAFILLYQLFQMTVTDVSKVGVPVTISK